ncbi:redox-regulated ATPase YchF [bacterium]|nr:redox-regulated ATPase YchF [bacterium]
MNLSVGIVGLPNAGKSTLFNALLKKQVADTAPYPFCTIEPNRGVVPVPDERLSVLAETVKTSKITPAVVEFVDIAGLVKGAHRGEGLGNQFLAHIREVSLICHVVRFFEDENVAHPEGKVNPVSDIEIINDELILADLATLEKQKPPKGKVEKEEAIFWEAVNILKKELNRGKWAREVELTEEQRNLIEKLCLLTNKKVIYLANLGENQLKKREEILRDFPFSPVIPLSARLEEEIVALTEEEQKEYLGDYQLERSGLERLIRLAYKELGLISFLTAGKKEVRAWTIQRGTTAKAAAGVIHSDFEKNFIKAEVIFWKDFVRYGGWVKARELGKVRSEGKDYLLKDGEVVEFRVGS